MKSGKNNIGSVLAGETPAVPFLRAKSANTAIKLISEGLGQKKSVVVVTGPKGAGKSRLIQEWQLEQDDQTQIERLDQPEREPDEVMAQVAKAFGLKSDDGVKRSVLVSDFRKHLIDLAAAGTACILVVDNAEDMSVEAVELLKMVANVQHKQKNLLRVVLLGQPRLLDVLRVSERPADAAKTGFVSIPPFDEKDGIQLFKDALAHQFGKAVKIDAAAGDEVFGASQGLPGAIVSLAQQLKTAMEGKPPKTVTADHVLGLEGIAGDEDEGDAKANLGDIQDASKLPRSIRESNDPQALLRFALTNRAGRETAAPEPAAAAPEPSAPIAPPQTPPAEIPQSPEDMPPDLGAALAQLAEAEQETVRKGGKVQALAPQRQEGRPGPMKLDGPIGGEARKAKTAASKAGDTKAAPKATPKATPPKVAAPKPKVSEAKGPEDKADSLAANDFDQFEFHNNADGKLTQAPVAASGGELPAPKPRPKTTNRKKIPSAVSGEAAPQVYDQSKLREVLRSFDEEPVTEKKRGALVPVLAGMAAVAALFAAYPYVLGPDGIAPLGGGANQRAEVSGPSLPSDPDGTAALPDTAVLAGWEQKKNLEVTRAFGPGPSANIALVAQPRAAAERAQDIEIASRPDPVLLSSRSRQPDVRPVRINPLQSDDASSLASSIALQATDTELANTLRLKDVAEQKIASLIGELSNLRGEVKELRGLKNALVQDVTTARDDLAQVEAELETTGATLAQEKETLQTVLAQRDQALTDLEAQSAELTRTQESLAALGVQENTLQAQFATMTDEVAALEGQLTRQQGELEALNAAMDTGREEQVELAALLDQGRTDLSALSQQAEERGSTLTDLEASLTVARAERDQLATEQLELSEESAKAENRLSAMTASLLSAEAAVAKAKDQKATLTASLDAETQAAALALEELTEKNDGLGAEIARLETEVAAAEAQKAEAIAQSETLKSESQNLAQALDVARTQSENFEIKRAEAEQQLAGLLPQVEQAQSTLSATQADLQKRASEVDAELAEALAELATLASQKQEYEADLSQLTTQVAQSSQARDKLTDELATLVHQRDALNADQSKLVAELSEVQSELELSNLALASAQEDRLNALAQLTEDTQAADGRLAQLQSQNAELIRQTVDLTNEIEAAGAQKQRFATEISELKAQSEALVAEVETKAREAETLEEQRNARAQELADLRESVALARQEQDAAEAAASLRLAAIASEAEGLLQTKDSVTTDIAALSERAAEAEEREAQAATVLSGLDGKIAQTRGDATAAAENLAKLETELRLARTDLAGLREEATQVETEIADLRNVQETETARLTELELNVETARSTVESLAELNRLESLQLEARELAFNQNLDQETVSDVASRASRGDDLSDSAARLPSALAALNVSIDRPNIGDEAPSPEPALRARQEHVVSFALQKAPGLSKLTGAERDALKAELVSGTCIPDALRKITGTINRQTLRALVRRIDRCSS